jgi:hypothetical protein
MDEEFEREIGSSMLPHEDPGNLIENEKWIEACQERLAILRPKMEEAKRKFIKEAARTLDIDQKALLERAKERFLQNYIEDDEKDIRREESKIASYGKPQEYLKKVEEAADAFLEESVSNVEPIDSDFSVILNILLDVKRASASQTKRADNALSGMSERDVMQTIRMMFENRDSIERLYEQWEGPWGDINILRSEARKRGIQEELLETRAIRGGETDLPYTNLVDVAVYKLDEEARISARITDKEFCSRYTYKHGKKIIPGSLKAARDGTALYGKRTARYVISERKGKGKLEEVK